MEDSQLPSPRRDLFPRRRSPMKSQTYRTLSRILSLFDDQNQPPRLVKFVPYQLPPGSLTLDDFPLSDVVENTDRGVYDHGKMRDEDAKTKEIFSEEKGGVVEESFEGVGLLERGQSETQMTLDEIADIMSIDEDDQGPLLNPKDYIAERSTEVVDFEDNGFNRERTTLDELQAIVNGYSAPLQDANSIKHNPVSSDENPCGNGTLELENKQVEHSGSEQCVVNEFTKVAVMLQDGEQLSQNSSETLCSSPGGNVVAPPQKENEEIKSALLRNSVTSADSALPTIPVVVDGQMEEKELSDGLEIDVPAHEDLEISQLPDEKHGKGQFSEAIVGGVGASSCLLDRATNASDDREEKVEEAGEGNVVCKDDFDSNANAKRLGSHRVDRRDNFIKVGKSEPQQRAAKEVASIPASRSNNLVFYGDILEENEVADRGLTSEKEDIDVNKKRKRGPGSQERKERKKQKERKKRAMKNRELGVKRLKLQPIVQKPKPIALCRHYIMGRCKEGEKCKFSHDTVPVTKSKPCTHFARHSCMKGDDCPFDHQLSKYPCSNFASKGSCIRGDSCLFSHKILSKEDPASAGTNASVPVSRPTVKPDDISIRKRSDIDGASDRAAGAVLDRLGISFKSMDQMIASSLGKSQVRKFIVGSYPVKDLTVASPVKSVHSNSSSKERDEGKLNNMIKESSSSGSMEKPNESVKAPPLIAPKGINFLTFSRSSSGNASADKQAKTNSETEENGSKIVFGSNETTARAQSLLGSQDLKNIFCVKTPNDASARKEVAAPSRAINTDDRSALGQQMNKLQNSSAKAYNLPTFPESSVQPAESSTPSPYKSISNSSQKVLSSTLAFAARCEKDTMMKNRSSGEHATCSTTSKETASGPEKNDSARALKILDFLSSIGKKK